MGRSHERAKGSDPLELQPTITGSERCVAMTRRSSEHGLGHWSDVLQSTPSEQVDSQ